MIAADFILRLLDPERDGPALHAIFGDADSCRYMTHAPFATVEETIDQLEKWTKDCEDTSWVIADSQEGPALGRVSIWPRGRNNVWDAACMLSPAARGRGLAYRALAIGIDHVFDRKGARRIVADIDPDNATSIRTFERLGFKYEGRLRGEWEMHIGIRDSLVYGLLRDDPRPWRR
jgi:RimJ/RimL family protein N-acetyltransferase